MSALICRLFGHRWIWARNDYKCIQCRTLTCSRCGITS